MKVPWGELAFAAVAGFAVRKLVGGDGGGSFPEPVVAERFAPQPLAIYLERVVWALTKDFEIGRIRQVRNFVNQHEYVLSTAFTEKIPPEEAARNISSMLSGEMAVPTRDDITQRIHERAERVFGPRQPPAIPGIPGIPGAAMPLTAPLPLALEPQVAVAQALAAPQEVDEEPEGFHRG